MSDEPDSITLRYLRRLDEKMDRMSGQMSDLKERVTAIEGHLVSVMGTLHSHSASIARLDSRLERVERSLDLHEEAS